MAVASRCGGSFCLAADVPFVKFGADAARDAVDFGGAHFGGCGAEDLDFPARCSAEFATPLRVFECGEAEGEILAFVRQTAGTIIPWRRAIEFDAAHLHAIPKYPRSEHAHFGNARLLTEVDHPA